jgi:hypothetical protein
MGYDLELWKLGIIGDTWAGFDLLSYSAGLLTAVPMLLLVALLAHLTDRPEREPEPEPAGGRVELLSINDLDPCPRCGGDHDRIDKREPCPPLHSEAAPEWDRYPGPIGS